jgi:hypothetical protein
MVNEVSLSTLLVPSKEVEVDYPGKEGFKIKLAFLSREEIVKIRKKATKITYKNRVATDELNEDLFLKLYVDATIKGWSGLKYKYLNELVLADLSKIKDLEECLSFSLDNALSLMKSSTEFDSFVSDTVSDLATFTKTS